MRFSQTTVMKPSLLRWREAHARVTFVELFFDLVFVFAVMQLSHSLVAHLTPGRALQTLFLLLAVCVGVEYTCWFSNWIDPDKASVRMLLFALMLAGLLMSAAIPNAFGHEGLLFAIAYTFIQVTRSLFMVAATRGRDPRSSGGAGTRNRRTGDRLLRARTWPLEYRGLEGGRCPHG